MKHPILRMGDPRLLRVAKPVEKFNTAELRNLISDMFETMTSVGGVGLAAPQIGVDLRLVVFGFDSSQRYPDAPGIPATILINPTLTPLTEETEEGWEGCLSVPGMRGSVPRFTHLRYTGFDENGLIIDRTVDGFHARVVQHECDHLDGILYPQRIKDMTRFGFNDALFPDQAIVED